MTNPAIITLLQTKDPGVDPSELSNREKTMAIDALKVYLVA